MATQGDKAGAAHHVLQVGAREALGLGGDPGQIDVAGERHLGGVDPRICSRPFSSGVPT
jgi:hypothetical protein